jgi:hypothetical protein
MPFYPAVVDALAMAHNQILEVKERLRKYRTMLMAH